MSSRNAYLSAAGARAGASPSRVAWRPLPGCSTQASATPSMLREAVLEQVRPAATTIDYVEIVHPDRPRPVARGRATGDRAVAGGRVSRRDDATHRQPRARGAARVSGDAKRAVRYAHERRQWRPDAGDRTREVRGRSKGWTGQGQQPRSHALLARSGRVTRECASTREPSDGPIGTMIRQVLCGRIVLPDGRAPGWATMALLFAADRMDHIESEIEPFLARRRDGHLRPLRRLEPRLPERGQRTRRPRHRRVDPHASIARRYARI